MGEGGSTRMNAIAQELLETAVSRFPVDSLTPVRKAALRQFAGSGFPTKKDEDWKYTNLSHAIDMSNAWLRRDTAGSPKASLTAAGRTTAKQICSSIDACWIVIANGIPDLELSSASDRRIYPAIEIARLGDDDLSTAIIADDPLTSFNAALLHDGLRVTVHPLEGPAKPLGILFLGGEESGEVSQARLIIDVESGANIDIVEVHASAGHEAQFSNTVVQLNACEGARVAYVRLQDCAETHIQVGKLIVEVHKDAILDYSSYDFGGLLVRNDIVITITQPGAMVYLHGLYLAGGNQHIDNHTRVDHTAGPAVSKEEYRGIIGGNAHCVFNGKAIVHKGADGTDAEQSNHNLLLSGSAEIDTKPELEIYADDVKCAHGATVGQLDSSALFYLQARGLDPEAARQLLTRAYIAPLLTLSPITAIHACIAQKTERKLTALITGEPNEQTPHQAN